MQLLGLGPKILTSIFMAINVFMTDMVSGRLNMMFCLSIFCFIFWDK